MNNELLIHCLIFIAVFIITSVILSKRAKKKKNKIVEDEYIEIQAEIIDVENSAHQAESDKEEVSKGWQITEE